MPKPDHVWIYSVAGLLGTALVFAVAGGCGSEAPAPTPPPQLPSSLSSTDKTPATNASIAPSSGSESVAEAVESTVEQPPKRRSLADLLETDNASQADSTATVQPSPLLVQAMQPSRSHIEIDDRRVAVAGIRKLVGRHLVLYTDVPSSPEVDELPTVFDAAVPLWCEYFQVDRKQVDNLIVIGFLMQEQPRFAATGLFPSDLPPFPHGFRRDNYIWVNDQTEAYYRRALVLHEGTHAFMGEVLGNLGPPWYSEGMAELMGAHRWQNNSLVLGYMPRDKSESPGWGRIKIVKDELAAGRGMMLEKIMEYGPDAHRRNEPYGWCWAACTFLDTHPLSQGVFREIGRSVAEDAVNSRLRQALQARWSQVSEDWQVFVMNLEYGYDIARAATVRRAAVPLGPDGATVRVQADRGWQSSGIALEAGQTYQITAIGRYQLRETTAPWICEPGGITISYYQGAPLGQLLGAVAGESHKNGLSSLVKGKPIGLNGKLTPRLPGTLFFKVNESAAELSDNQGHIDVQITRSS